MSATWAGAGILLFYVAVRVFMEARRARRLRVSRRRFTEHGPPRLSPGLATLAGTVETDAPEGVAIRLCAPYRSFALAREGELRWGIWAEEAERSFAVHPFTLIVEGSGARVRVRPEVNVNLLTWPESAGPEPGPVSERLYALTLRAGERVVVEGMLASASSRAGAYRGDDHDFVLYTPRGSSLVIETEQFAVGRDRMPRFFRCVGDALFAVMALVYLVVLGVHLHGGGADAAAGSPLETAMIACVIGMGVVVLGWVSALLGARQESEPP